MLPPLTMDGVLPPGIHIAPSVEVIQRFGGSDGQRNAVTQRLQYIFDVAQRTNQLRRLFLWGSYITDKARPGDVDVFLVMAADFLSELCDTQAQAMFDGERAERELGATVLWTREDVSAELLRMFLDQWQIRRNGTRLGIVEVEL